MHRERNWLTKAANSTALLRISWFRAETLLEAMAQEVLTKIDVTWNVNLSTLFCHKLPNGNFAVTQARASTVRSLLMRTSSWSITVLAGCRWLMLAKTQMAPSFSSPPPRRLGSTANMWSLAKLLRAWYVNLGDTGIITFLTIVVAIKHCKLLNG